MPLMGSQPGEGLLEANELVRAGITSRLTN